MLQHAMTMPNKPTNSAGRSHTASFLAIVHLAVLHRVISHGSDGTQPQPSLLINAELVDASTAQRLRPVVLQLDGALGCDTHSATAPACIAVETPAKHLRRVDDNQLQLSKSVWVFTS